MGRGDTACADNADRLQSTTITERPGSTLLLCFQHSGASQYMYSTSRLTRGDQAVSAHTRATRVSALPSRPQSNTGPGQRFSANRNLNKPATRRRTGTHPGNGRAGGGAPLTAGASRRAQTSVAGSNRYMSFRKVVAVSARPGGECDRFDSIEKHKG